MGEDISPKRNNVRSLIDITGEEELRMASPTQLHAATRTHVFGVSPRNGGSTLYDSYELVAMTNQLNKVMMQGRLNNPSPTLITYLESPFYRRQVNKVSHDNSKAPRRITCPRNTTGLIGTGGFFSRLWKKVKQGLVRNKH